MTQALRVPEAIALALAVASIAIVIVAVPHGARVAVWTTAFCGIFSYIAISVVARLPLRMLNLPVTITDSNRDRVARVIGNLWSWFKMWAVAAAFFGTCAASAIPGSAAQVEFTVLVFAALGGMTITSLRYIGKLNGL